ncbi:conserved Plasmodium protein, unknown function [Plasmodium knowlesi strain H]|uniref:Uncharacterized protein n=3 Tax=Plasmodium knowlesi TaxID=5850 RepID=A0A5K1UT96_PLAKH|nr:conserved Plasmodium protein, unknown function [Plasmodium knowlesi strain H]OTN65552.1 Uncharacterized protein PKNOH_S110096300 [Plasmodium knowlesi]CAA9989582.1 conserved Plasmodium protein, unknown function [Plasmodium knowlesi strain H]SBO22634.1 conserved Plasmodium protein, unknown function [Plasmodium knowlesi strain H]SBO23423.1 conserved Plasmodium protein, unknown function [Plasmodium knowlesi strain H]VVS79056.1 conserved Plasmodium protein, unknown function [Plasmodium knowlesi |eukprot:XP_002260307.1 hypothetical protein, conserved in Plasmodium species [Plasmodium knowlesi strain H]
MDKKKRSGTSSTFKEIQSFSKSYLDLSNYSKDNYQKQNSINNTNEVFEFFTSITNNQKDISKKYEQLFSLIKKFGKEIKYLLAKNDEYNSILIDTKECVKRIKAKISGDSCEEFENLEEELLKDKNNIDVISRIVTYLWEEIGYYSKNSSEWNKKIEELKKYIGSKDEFIKLERKLTVTSEELKKEMIDNMSSLREQQDLKMKIKEERNIYRKDIQNVHEQILYVILKFLLRDKRYKTQKYFFLFWLNTTRRRKEATNQMISCLGKKLHCLLYFCFRKLRSNSFEGHLIDKVMSLVDFPLHGNGDQGSPQRSVPSKAGRDYDYNGNANETGNRYSSGNHQNSDHYRNSRNTLRSTPQERKKSSVFSNLVNSDKTRDGDNMSPVSYDHVNSISRKRSESMLFYKTENSSATQKSDVATNLYDQSGDFSSGKRDTQQFANDSEDGERDGGNDGRMGSRIGANGSYGKNGSYQKNASYEQNGPYDRDADHNSNYAYQKNSLPAPSHEPQEYPSRKSNEHAEKMYDNLARQMRDKADRKSVEMIHQTIKKLNNKINDIRDTLDKQNKIMTNDDMHKIFPHEKSSQNSKNYSNKKHSDLNCNLSLANSSLNLPPERTLSEYLINKNKSRNTNTDELNRTKGLRKQSEQFQKMSEYNNFPNKYDNHSHKKSYENMEKWNVNNDKYSHSNSMNMTSVDESYLYQRHSKSTARSGSHLKNDASVLGSNIGSGIGGGQYSSACSIKGESKRGSRGNSRGETRTESRRNSKHDSKRYPKSDSREVKAAHNTHHATSSRRDFIENSNASSSPSDIKLILRTGGGFRKLSENCQKNYIEKLNYLNDNKLLGYETNLNIKIKGHPFIHNVPNGQQKEHKKEKRHRSLSKFYNMH